MAEASSGRTPDGYIGQVLPEDLIAANRNKAIDGKSQTLLEQERKYLELWRQANKDVEGRSADVRNSLTGLALSGGGIRSATFSLGVTQALAARDLMRRFDYLSTVSGGGYLGASLTWLTRRDAQGTRPRGFMFGFRPKTFPYGVDPPDKQTNRLATPAQDKQLIYLRHHGKYLTPGNGIDLVSGIAIVLRGILLNLLVWVPLVALALLILLLLPFPWTVSRLPRGGYAWVALLAFAAAVFFLVASATYSLATKVTSFKEPWRYRARRCFERDIRYPLWTIAVCAPIALLPYLDHAVGSSGTGGLSTLVGFASAAWGFLKSRSDGEGSGALSIIAPVGAALVLYGILMLGYSWADSLVVMAPPEGCPTFPWPHSAPVSCGPSWLWTAITVVLIVAAFVTGEIVNVNLISIHRYYRDRLMEAFMPDPPEAETKPAAPGNPGLDGTKRVFSNVASAADVSRLQSFAEVDDKHFPTGPYHLLNTNLILIGSDEWAWRVRGGDSFILSPLFCGSNATGWCRTEDFLGGELSLPTAMAISGAAADPDAGGGLFRDRFVAVLMALANLRLGYWVGHPERGRERLKRRTHFGAAWRELSSHFTQTSDLLQLSDGGHFENLGIYELIRRRARLIIVCDGTADPKFAFGDFVTAVTLVAEDFGARINFVDKAGLGVFMPSRPAGYPKDTEVAERGYALAKITYSDGGKDEDGRDTTGDLIYVTTTLAGQLGIETMGYKAANPDFPDQTTADQFFDEAQFEAYRNLGYCVAATMLDDPQCQKIIEKWMGGR